MSDSASPTTGPALSRVARIRLDGGPPPRLCAGCGWGHGALYDFHSAYFGEYVQPPPREVERDAEKPHASVPAQVGGYRLYKPVHKEEVCGPGGGAGWVEAAAGVQPVGLC